MKKLKEVLIWMALGALLSLLLSGMYFCSLQAVNGVNKCKKSDQGLCNFFEILIEKESLGPLGYIYYDTKDPPS